MPVPLRHRALQPSPDTWIRTPSPSSSRAISPSSSLAGVFPRAHQSYSSFCSIMEVDKEILLQEQGLGRRWLRWMHKNGLKHWVVPCTLLASAAVRWCIGMGSYSGKQVYEDPLVCLHVPFLFQARESLLCSETMKPNGIGWSSPTTFQRASGTHTIYNIGV